MITISLAHKFFRGGIVRKFTLIMACLAGTVVTAARAELIVNGSFEDPVMQPQSISDYGPNTGLGAAAWTVDVPESPGTDGVALFGPGPYPTGWNFPSNGTNVLQMTTNYGTGGGIHQTIATVVDQLYAISVDIGSRSNTATGTLKFGNSAFTLTPDAYTGPNQAFKTVTFQATATGTSTLINILGNNPSSSAQLVIDNVSVVAAVPEPSTILLLGLGLLGLMRFRVGKRCLEF